MIQVDFEDFDYVNGIYKVVKANLDVTSWQVTLDLVEYDKTAYDWDPNTYGTSYSVEDTGVTEEASSGSSGSNSNPGDGDSYNQHAQ